MKLIKIQEHLIKGLHLYNVPKDQAIGIMLFLKDNENGMMELMDYMRDEYPTPHQIIKKSIEISERGRARADNCIFKKNVVPLQHRLSRLFLSALLLREHEPSGAKRF